MVPQDELKKLFRDVSLCVLFVWLHLSSSVSSDTKNIIRTEIFEEVPENTIVHNVLKTLQQYNQEDIHYSDFVLIVSNPIIRELFRIEDNSGILRTKRKIDRDTLCQIYKLCCDTRDTTSDPSLMHYVQPLIQDGSSSYHRTSENCELTFRVIFQIKSNHTPDTPSEIGYKSISVKILDVNDNRPHFKPSESHLQGKQLLMLSKDRVPVHSIEMEENIPKGSCLNLPDAVDEDSRLFGITEYRIEHLTESELFTLARYHSTQKIRHQRQDWPFALVLNSCSSKQTELSFATDSSSQTHGILKPFLKVVGTVDREHVDEYWFKLLAVDGGQFVHTNPSLSTPNSYEYLGRQRHTGTILIQIRVKDVNDHAPLVPETLQLQVREDVQVGVVVGTIKATDEDIGENAKLKYIIDENNRNLHDLPFRINPTSGAIMVSKSLDADLGTINQYVQFKVITQDSGKPLSQSATTDVTITLIDINDETPVVKALDLKGRGSPPQPSVVENKPPGQLIAFITATDRDQGQYGSLHCVVDNSKFDLLPLPNINSEQNKGVVATNIMEFKLVTTTALDREANPYERIKVSCMDSPNQLTDTRTGTAMLTVTVLDENDHFPTFSSGKIILNVYENEPVDHLVTKFNVTDADHTSPSVTFPLYVQPHTTESISFSLDKIGQEYFRIDEKKGIMYVRQVLDREHLSELDFTVIAVDNGSPPKTATASVHVNILDRNDNAPEFVQQVLDLEVYENVTVDTVLTSVRATDKDDGINAKIVYYLEDLQGISDRYFRVDKRNGSLSIRAPLDRENNDQFKFRLIAMDHGKPRLSSSCSVQIRVLDVNDNDPKFVYPTQKNHTIYASAYLSLNLPLVKLTAVDEDEGVNAKLKFYLESSPEGANFFYLDEDTGELSVTGVPDATKLLKHHELKFRVQDMGDPSRSAHTSMTIFLNGTSSQSDSQGSDLAFTNSRYRSNQDRGPSATASSRLSYAGIRNAKHERTQLKWDDDYQDEPNMFYLTPERALIIVISLVTVSAVIAFLLLVTLGILRRRRVNGTRHLAKQPPSDQPFGTFESKGDPDVNQTYACRQTIRQTPSDELFCTIPGDFSQDEAQQFHSNTLDRPIFYPKHYKPATLQTFPLNSLPMVTFPTYSCRDDYMKCALNDETRLNTMEKDNNYATRLAEPTSYQVINEVRGCRSCDACQSEKLGVRFKEDTQGPLIRCDCSVSNTANTASAASSSELSMIQGGKIDKLAVNEPLSSCTNNALLYM